MVVVFGLEDIYRGLSRTGQIIKILDPVQCARYVCVVKDIQEVHACGSCFFFHQQEKTQSSEYARTLGEHELASRLI